MPYGPVSPDTAWCYAVSLKHELAALTEQQRQEFCATLKSNYAGNPVDTQITEHFRLRYDGDRFQICLGDGTEVYCMDESGIWDVLKAMCVGV